MAGPARRATSRCRGLGKGASSIFGRIPTKGVESWHQFFGPPTMGVRPRSQNRDVWQSESVGTRFALLPGMKTWIWALIAASVMATACGDAQAPERYTQNNVADMCAFPKNVPTSSGSLRYGHSDATFLADEPIIVITQEGCLSACAHDKVATCEITVEGDTLQVTSQMSWDPANGNVDCIAVCEVLSAQCKSPPLAAGEYEIHYGTKTAKLQIGTTSRPPCLLDR